jgi:hypothetical protein
MITCAKTTVEGLIKELQQFNKDDTVELCIEAWMDSDYGECHAYADLIVRDGCGGSDVMSASTTDRG